MPTTYGPNFGPPPAAATARFQADQDRRRGLLAYTFLPEPEPEDEAPDTTEDLLAEVAQWREEAAQQDGAAAYCPDCGKQLWKCLLPPYGEGRDHFGYACVCGWTGERP